MPLYMGLLWAWEKIWGSSELALRSLNAPFFLAACLAAVFFPRGTAIWRPWWITLASFSPYVWYYLDEARPYILQFFGSSLMVFALWNLGPGRAPNHSFPRGDVMVLLGGAMILSGSSLLGVVYAFCFLGAAFAIMVFKKVQWSGVKQPGFWAGMLVAAGIFLALVSYYVATILRGARGFAAGPTNWASLAFSGYELLGFGGLGPSRLELREVGAFALLGWWPWLGLMGISWLLAAWAMATTKSSWGELWQKHRRWFFIVSFACLLACVGIIAAGVLGPFRILGRHFMPVFPFVLLALAIPISEAWPSRNPWVRAALFTWLAMLALSAFSGRFASRHAKDDYRGASRIAAAALAQGQVVWWVAEPRAAAFYGLGKPAASGPGEDGLYFVINRSREQLREFPPPQLVVYSRRDVFDRQDAVAEFLAQGWRIAGTRPGFSIWRAFEDRPKQDNN